jgi:hypothetical protein
MEKLKVYVGCGLTHVPQSYKEYITSFKDELRKIEWIEIMDFAGAQLDEELDEVHAHRVYKRDIHECVGTRHFSRKTPYKNFYVRSKRCQSITITIWGIVLHR